ncbi:MAG: methyltransferase type 11 [Verrucomicrobia bacterium]|nr:methyltransferase type 11 [Verrucomicrobiota bacterium]
MATINREFYDALWSRARLHPGKDFNTWPLVADLLPSSMERLEVGPGLSPRLPLAGTHFVDLSAPVVERLNASGGLATLGEISALPFPARRFDLVAAFDVVEHVEDEQRVFGELTRVLKPGGHLILSVPLHPARWTEFDVLVGHARRYEAPALRAILARHQLTVVKSAGFGMRPTSPWVLHVSMRLLTRYRTIAMRCHNWLFMPLGLIFQKRLRFTPGWIDSAEADGIVLVCRRED